MLREEDLPDDPYELLKLYDHYVDLLAKITYEESLYQFVKAAWPIIEPGSPFIDNWHIKTICGYIEAFHYGRLPDKRLIISVSPASAKSVITSVMYPAWAWTTVADERIMTVSNEQGLSTRDARRMKQIVTSEWYQRYWPITISTDQNEKTLFTNDKSGSRQAIGITSSVSGKRCFPEYMGVMTDKGEKFISNIVVGDNVSSMDIDTGLITYKPATHVHCNPPSEIVEVIFSNGLVIHCTPDHEFLTQKGYVEAQKLTVAPHLSPNIIDMVRVKSENLAQLFARHGGITDKDFVLFGEYCFGKNTVLPTERGNNGWVAIKLLGKLNACFGKVKDNILIFLADFNNGVGDPFLVPPVRDNSPTYASIDCRLLISPVGVKNDSHLAFSNPPFKYPRVLFPFFNRLLSPIFTQFYSPYAARVKPVFFGDNLIIPSIKADSLGYFSRILSSRPIAAHRKCSVGFSISNIVASSSPRKVINGVIKRVSVKVANFMFGTGLSAIPCRTNSNMDVDNGWLPIVMPFSLKIAPPIIRYLKHLGFPAIRPSMQVIMNKPWLTSDKAAIADGVDALIADDGTPLNAVSVRKVGHINKTYCLTVKDNHNMFVGKEGRYALASNCSILVIDDPIDTKHAFSDVINQTVLDTYDQALSTRLNDFEKSGILLIMQRTRHDDLTGHLLKKVKSKWTHLSIPMRYEGFPAFDAGKDIGNPELNDPRTQKGELMFPQRASEKVVQSLEEDLGEFGTSSQLQQRPSPLGGGILKQQWWRIWPDDKPFPTMTHIFHSWDTAFDANDLKTNAASACTRWGIFWSEERDRWLIMCLGVWYGWVGFDELRRKLKELDDKHKPDANLIERKATGISLYNDLRKASPGRIRGYIPKEDKVSRAHSVSPMLQAGLCYVPNRKWALGDHDKKIIGFVEYLARFPTAPSPSPDLTDTATQGLIYMRSGNWAGEHPDDVELPFDNTIRRTDEQEEDIIVERKRSIYG